MTVKPQMQYFLGANSRTGFFSLYDQLVSPEKMKSVYIIKGGAGCGKSTLMKEVAKIVQEEGYPVEYIWCSGDTQSLDGIHLVNQRTAMVDGTAPHVIEPSYPGVVEHYVNLGACYNREALGGLREEITQAMAGYKGCYKRAYGCISAVAELSESLREVLITPALEERIAKRAHGIVIREMKRKGSAAGRVRQCFLGGVTHDGLVCHFDTVEGLCTRVYELSDHFGLGHQLITYLATAAAERGYDIILSPSPVDPQRLEHLLIPELSLAFVTSGNGVDYPKHPYRRIRMDAMVESEVLRSAKPLIRFSKKMSAALMGEAVEALASAKSQHDELESIYNPYVDFDRVHQTAQKLANEILSK